MHNPQASPPAANLRVGEDRPRMAQAARPSLTVAQLHTPLTLVPTLAHALTQGNQEGVHQLLAGFAERSDGNSWDFTVSRKRSARSRNRGSRPADDSDVHNSPNPSNNNNKYSNNDDQDEDKDGPSKDDGPRTSNEAQEEDDVQDDDDTDSPMTSPRGKKRALVACVKNEGEESAGETPTTLPCTRKLSRAVPEPASPMRSEQFEARQEEGQKKRNGGAESHSSTTGRRKVTIQRVREPKARKEIHFDQETMSEAKERNPVAKRMKTETDPSTPDASLNAVPVMESFSSIDNSSSLYNLSVVGEDGLFDPARLFNIQPTTTVERPVIFPLLHKLNLADQRNGIASPLLTSPHVADSYAPAHQPLFSPPPPPPPPPQAWYTMLIDSAPPAPPPPPPPLDPATYSYLASPMLGPYTTTSLPSSRAPSPLPTSSSTVTSSAVMSSPEYRPRPISPISYGLLPTWPASLDQPHADAHEQEVMDYLRALPSEALELGSGFGSALPLLPPSLVEPHHTAFGDDLSFLAEHMPGIEADAPLRQQILAPDVVRLRVAAAQMAVPSPLPSPWPCTVPFYSPSLLAPGAGPIMSHTHRHSAPSSASSSYPSSPYAAVDIESVFDAPVVPSLASSPATYRSTYSRGHSHAPAAGAAQGPTRLLARRL